MRTESSFPKVRFRGQTSLLWSGISAIGTGITPERSMRIELYKVISIHGRKLHKKYLLRAKGNSFSRFRWLRGVVPKKWGLGVMPTRDTELGRYFHCPSWGTSVSLLTELSKTHTENELLKGQYELSCIAAARTVAMES